MMQIANILQGQWPQHLIYRYAVWVHRLSRAVAAELKQLPEQPPPLPWPEYQKPVNEVRTYNSALFPKFPAKPKRRAPATTYVPKSVDLERARIEVYRPESEKGDDFLWRIKLCWDHPRLWSVEAVVDRGGILYLPFLREVTIRLPLKAKVCRELKAKKDGRWVGECLGVKKLNVREAIVEATKWIMENGQGITKSERPINNEELTMNNVGTPAAHGSLLTARFSGQAMPEPIKNELRTAVRPDLGRTNHPQGLRPFPLLSQGGEFLGAARHPEANGQSLKANGSLPANGQQLTANRSAPANSYSAHSWRRRLPLEGALHVEGFYPRWERSPWKYETPLEKKRRLDRFEREEMEEREAIGFILQHGPGLNVNYGPAFLRGDDFDGYLLRRDEFGPDPWDFDWPEPRLARYLNDKWRARRKPKRYPTVRDRLAAVKPSLRIVPAGKRSAELIITRRLHELSFGIGEALHLARMIEGAIKFRAPLKPGRKRTWRQDLRSHIVNDPSGLLRWLVLNPITAMDSGKGRRDNGGADVLDLGPVDHAVLKNRKDRPLPKLTNLFLEAGLPKPYLGLIDRSWLTEDGNLFAATPAGEFATKIEGFPLRLPIAVMPVGDYERWRARNGYRPKPRRRGRRKPELRRCRHCLSPRAKDRAATVRQAVSLSRGHPSATSGRASP